MRFSRVVAFAALLCATQFNVAPAQEVACKRPAAKQFRDGETIVITQPRSFPCKMVLRDTPVELRADEAGVVSNIGVTLLRMNDGRFITYTGRGELTLWGADGKFVKNVGRTGQGPGEFANSGMTLHQAPNGTVYVRDNNMRWSALTPSLEFVKHTSAVGMGFGAKESAFLDDGKFLASSSVGSGAATTFFTIYDFEQSAPPADAPTGRANAPAGPGPSRIAAFGAVSPEERAAASGRMISYAGGNTFWAGPPSRVGRGYELELWSTRGVLLQKIRRDAPWFPKGADVPPPRGPEGQGIPQRPVTVVTMLHADSAGLLYVLVAAASDAWKPIPRSDPASRANEERAYDLYFEVIDASAGVVLASSGPMTRAEALASIPPQMFRGSAQGYRIAETPEGLPIRRIVDVRLMAQ